MAENEGVITGKDILLGIIITAAVAVVVVILYDVVKEHNSGNSFNESKE